MQVRASSRESRVWRPCPLLSLFEARLSIFSADVSPKWTRMRDMGFSVVVSDENGQYCRVRTSCERGRKQGGLSQEVRGDEYGS